MCTTLYEWYVSVRPVDRYANRLLLGGTIDRGCFRPVTTENLPITVDFDHQWPISCGISRGREKEEEGEEKPGVASSLALSVAHRLPVRGPLATGQFRQKSAVGGRLRKKKGRRTGKEKKEEGKKEYLAGAVLARLPSSPTGRLRAVVAHGRDRGRFFSHTRRQIEASSPPFLF
ncbi:hypothetical protein GW17_00016236 [Ensete ventricosum]|nr:hypothetical protein GW17_00016236 [Ensete ventricosum]